MAFASRSHARALAARFPHIDHVWITAKKLICFHMKEFDEMRYWTPLRIHVRSRNTKPYIENYGKSEKKLQKQELLSLRISERFVTVF